MNVNNSSIHKTHLKFRGQVKCLLLDHLLYVVCALFKIWITSILTAEMNKNKTSLQKNK